MEFDSDRKSVVVHKIQRYFEAELNQEIGQFDAEFLLDFFASEIGPEFYNQGLQDAQAVLSSRIDDIQDAIAEIEKPPPS
ncbi:MAG: DUF2164 domain-containing protein [Halieaceae bacterium]